MCQQLELVTDPNKVELKPEYILSSKEQIENFICSIFQCIAWNPLQCKSKSSCDKLFCAVCLDSFKDNKKHFCPICRSQSEFLKVDMFNLRPLLDLEFSCDKKDCTMKNFKYTEALEHSKACSGFLELPCPFKCGYDIDSKLSLGEHLN